jgi:hypothetical protein
VARPRRRFAERGFTTFGFVVILLLSIATCGWASTTSGHRASASSREVPVRFRSGGNMLRGVLAVPDGGGRHAAVVLLSGSERSGASAPVHVEHARVLARRGVAVLRYDPPGVGRSTGDLRFETLDDRSSEALAAVEYLRSRPDIDAHRVGLWGVSQGGWVTQMAAARSRSVAFVVSVSGAGISVAEQQVFSVEAQSRAARFSRDDVARAGLFARLLVDWQLTRPAYREQNSAQVRRLGPGPWQTFSTLVYEPGRLTPAQSLQRGIAILRSIRSEPWAAYLYLDTAVLPLLEAIPPAKAAAARKAAERSLLVRPEKYLKAVRCPVLAMWGEDDTLVPARKSAAVYRKVLALAGNRDVTTIVFAHADHSIDGFSAPYWQTLERWLQRHLLPN